MKPLVPTLPALSLAITSCTPAQITAIEQLAEAYRAQLHLTATDENGNATAIRQADVQTVELDGQVIPAAFSPDGHLLLPGGDYAQDHELRVRLRDGSDIALPLNARQGARQGKSILFAGALHRLSGRIVAADLVPGGQTSEGDRITARESVYVQIPINRPALVGRIRTMGIDQQRLAADACMITAQGDLMIHRTLLQRYARQGSKLWAVVDMGTQQAATVSRHNRYDSYPPAANRYAVVVLQLTALSPLPAAPAWPNGGYVCAETRAQRIVLHPGSSLPVA